MAATEYTYFEEIDQFLTEEGRATYHYRHCDTHFYHKWNSLLNAFKCDNCSFVSTTRPRR